MTRGRQNAERNRFRGRKPKPPANLTAAEAAIWSAVCATQDGAWCELAAASSLLSRYCIARAFYDLLVAQRRTILDAATGEGALAGALKDLATLSEEINKQDAAVLRLERALRLTVQSRQEPKGTKNSPVEPWGPFPEDDGDTA